MRAARPLPTSIPPFPAPRAVLELLHPITWFAPMWAYACGVVSVGGPADGRLLFVVLGILLAGPLVCATSQAANDWYDRHVDAINEPDRPIPSGRIPGRWGLWLAVIGTGASLAVAAFLGPWGFGAACVALAMAWAYSAPPLRLKRNGWWGAAACGACYEGLPWFTGAAVTAGAFPETPVLLLAALYSLGALGIMPLNDFKAMEGDARMGVRSLPVMLGARRAALAACALMALPQAVVVALLIVWGHAVPAAIVGALLAAQLLLMRPFLRDPRGKAPWYNATGTGLYVLGMMVAAVAIG